MFNVLCNVARFLMGKCPSSWQSPDSQPRWTPSKLFPTPASSDTTWTPPFRTSLSKFIPISCPRSHVLVGAVNDLYHMTTLLLFWCSHKLYATNDVSLDTLSAEVAGQNAPAKASARCTPSSAFDLLGSLLSDGVTTQGSERGDETIWIAMAVLRISRTQYQHSYISPEIT